MDKSMPEFGWDNDKTFQRLWIRIYKWSYKIFFSSLKSHRILFQFDGKVCKVDVSSNHSLEGMEVSGDIEIPSELEIEELQPNFGTFSLVDEGGPPFLGVSLFAGHETFDELLKAFSAASSNDKGIISLELGLHHPKSKKPGFWRTGWQKTTISVAEIRFYTGGELII